MDCDEKLKDSRQSEISLPEFGTFCVRRNSNIYGDCQSKEDFGYTTGSPCIFLALDKLNWQPITHKTSSDLPLIVKEAFEKNHTISVSLCCYVDISFKNHNIYKFNRKIVSG